MFEPRSTFTFKCGLSYIISNLCTRVKFACKWNRDNVWKVEKIEKVERRSTFTFTRDTSYSLYFICIDNSMICSDIWHKYHKWYFKIVIRNFTSCQASEIWDNFEIDTSGFYAKYHVQIMLLFVYNTTRKRSVIFTCRHFKLSWNTTALSQSNCRNFSYSTINAERKIYVCSHVKITRQWKSACQLPFI